MKVEGSVWLRGKMTTTMAMHPEHSGEGNAGNGESPASSDTIVTGMVGKCLVMTVAATNGGSIVVGSGDGRRHSGARAWWSVIAASAAGMASEVGCQFWKREWLIRRLQCWSYGAVAEWRGRGIEMVAAVFRLTASKLERL